MPLQTPHAPTTNKDQHKTKGRNISFPFLCEALFRHFYIFHWHCYATIHNSVSISSVISIFFIDIVCHHPQLCCSLDTQSESFFLNEEVILPTATMSASQRTALFRDMHANILMPTTEEEKPMTKLNAPYSSTCMHGNWKHAFISTAAMYISSIG